MPFHTPSEQARRRDNDAAPSGSLANALDNLLGSVAGNVAEKMEAATALGDALGRLIQGEQVPPEEIVDTFAASPAAAFGVGTTGRVPPRGFTPRVIEGGRRAPQSLDEAAERQARIAAEKPFMKERTAAAPRVARFNHLLGREGFTLGNPRDFGVTGERGIQRMFIRHSSTDSPAAAIDFVPAAGEGGMFVASPVGNVFWSRLSPELRQRGFVAAKTLDELLKMLMEGLRIGS